MSLSRDLISQFVKITKDDKKTKNETTVYGTTVVHNGKQYVKLDGSELLTPVVTTANTKNGERVTVMIKNHTATVTGNISSPAARTQDVKDTNDAITEVEILVANKVDTSELATEKARIDELNAETILVKETLIASGVDTEELKATTATITETLKVNRADIDELYSKKIDADIADVKYAAIEDLVVTDANVHNLNASYGEFAELTTRNFTTANGRIENLNTSKANIDFSNIQKAAIEQLFTKSGMIKDLVVGEGTITGKLVGVTIRGDLIEGNTIKAEKLVVKGADGLYYKLNTNGMKVEAEQTDQNSLNGSIITAKSITATKISVDDLVAFDATIGGFNITDDSIYSGVKESVDNTTRGIYLDNDGQIAFGDNSNYLKYYKDKDGSYKLEIAAKSITFGLNNESVETVLTNLETATNKSIVSTTEQFYQSTSATSLSGGTWSNTQPTWYDGKYIWRRTLVKYGDGSTTYTPSSTGICITGNTGAKGDTGATGSQGPQGPKGDTGATGPAGPQGDKGDTGATGAQGPKGDTGATGKGVKTITNYYLASTSSSGVTTSTSGWTTTVQNVTATNKYLWNYEVVTYTDNTTYSTTPCVIGAYGNTGATGPQGPQGPKGDTGATGSTGATGNGIASITEKYAVSTSNTTAPTSWNTTPPTMTATNKYLWNYEIITYTNGTTADTQKRVIGVYGDKGATGSTGATGAQGPQGEQGPKGDTGATGAQGPKGDTGATGKGVKSIVNYYLASSSSSGVTSSTSGWTTTVQNVTSSKKYLWNYEVVTYTDNSTYSTTPCIIGAYGDTGATGAQGPKGDTGATGAQGPKGDTGATGSTGATGNGISSIAEKYAVSTSNTSAPTSWSDTPPTMTATNKYLWNYEIITYTNGTTASTQKRVIGVYGDKGATGSTGATGPKGDTGATGATGPKGDTGAAGKDANAIAHTFSGTSGTAGYVAFATVEITQTYCNAPCSFRLANRGQEMSDVQFQFASVNGLDPGLSYIRADGGIKLWMVKIATSKWQIIAQKSEAYDNFTLFNFNKPANSGGYTVTWTNTHLTSVPSGSIAAGLLSSAKTATNYMNLDNSGLVVGNLTASTLGKNVLIASDAVNIRTGTTVNAVFSEKRIELGRNASDAVIELCGDKGEIEYDATAGYLQVTGDSLRLKGSNESALYTDYYNGAEIGKKAYVTTSMDQVNITASESRNLNDSGVGTWTTSELRVSPQEVYTLTDNILEMSRYGSTYETLTGDITLNPSGKVQLKKSVFVSKDAKTAHNDGVAGWYLGTDGTAHATNDTSGPAICFHYAGDTANTSIIRESAKGEITINGFNIAKNKVLWSGEMYMSASQSVALSEAISAQTNGIVLVFSRYSSGTAQNYHFNTHFIPKSQVSSHAGTGHIILLSSDGSFGLFASKYLYINNTSIAGNDINTSAGTGACNIKYDNKAYVLRYVIGV